MNDSYTNITVKKETALELDLKAKKLNLTKDETVRRALKALPNERKSTLREIQEKYKKEFGDFKATEKIDLDDIDVSEAYI